VGGYAVQLAKRAGATVTATAGARSYDRIRSYGADRIIDYTAALVPQSLAGQRFDVVLPGAPRSRAEARSTSAAVTTTALSPGRYSLRLS